MYDKVAELFKLLEWLGGLLHLLIGRIVGIANLPIREWTIESRSIVSTQRKAFFQSVRIVSMDLVQDFNGF